MKNKCLISMAVYDTVDNRKTKYTIRTVASLLKTTCKKTTRIFIIDNNSCKETREFLIGITAPNVTVIFLKNNIGTAEAINLGFKERTKDEYCVKIDNDVEIHDDKWIEKMIYCYRQEPKLGILGLKRKDLPNKPDSEQYPTKLRYVGQKLGDPWHIIEECGDIIGTCLMFSPEVLDEIGYLYQPSLYGFDDVLACKRTIKAGYFNAFYPSVEIDHIDTDPTPFVEWKKQQAGIWMEKYIEYDTKIWEGINPVQDHDKEYYYNPFEDEDDNI